MSDYNLVTMTGRLTADPTISIRKVAECNFRIASSRKWKRGIEMHEETCFLDCQAYAGTAEMIHKHFRRGRRIMVNGILRYEQWEKDGVKRSKHVLLVQGVTFIDEKQKQTPSEPGGDEPRASATDGDQPGW